MVPVEQPVEVNGTVEQTTLGYAQLETLLGPGAVLEGIYTNKVPASWNNQLNIGNSFTIRLGPYIVEKSTYFLYFLSGVSSIHPNK